VETTSISVAICACTKLLEAIALPVPLGDIERGRST
jgi:hypothetical protein